MKDDKFDMMDRIVHGDLQRAFESVIAELVDNGFSEMEIRSFIDQSHSKACRFIMELDLPVKVWNKVAY